MYSILIALMQKRIKEQIEYHKYVFNSDCFDVEEKGISKQELRNLMLELKELTKQIAYCNNYQIIVQ